MLVRPQASQSEPTIAMISWSAVLEDFLDPLGISLETFCAEFRGSWMFGYIEALKQAGVRTVLICMSARVAAPLRTTHVPSGATLCILPTPWLYSTLRRKIIYPYGQTVGETFGEIRGKRRLLLPLYALAQDLSLYLSTPLRLIERELRRTDHWPQE